MNFIEPILKKHKSLNDLLESKEYSYFFESNIHFSEILDSKQTFIISEPGYGKTTLLKELLFQFTKTEGIFLDLKKIGNGDIETFIKKNEKDFTIYDPTLNFETINLFKTKNFKLLNKKEITFCLDALDEVKQEDFAQIVNNIKSFIKKYNRTKFLLSCRKNYIRKWQHIFSECNFNYIEIYPFDNGSVKKYLLQLNIEEKAIDKVINKLNLGHRVSTIQVPRYLKMLIDLYKEQGIKIFENTNRNDIFEKFVYHKLNIEKRKNTHGLNNKEIIKKVLEKLALIMEIYQTNIITKDELMEFFDDTKSNLNVNFLSQVKLEELYDRSLLKDNIDTIEFENTEFQEYLAAKEINKLGRTEQVVFDLSIVKGVESIHPSWINTLSFLIDFDIKLLKNIIKYIFIDKNNIHIEDHFKLITKFNIDKLDKQEKHEIFKTVFSYFQDKGLWINYELAENISFYFDEDLNYYLKDYCSSSKKGELKKIQQANLATLIGFLVENNNLNITEKNFWITKIKKYIYDKNINQITLRRSIFALEKFDDINLFTEHLINKVFQIGEESVIDNLIYALGRIDPNNKKSYNLFLRGIKVNNSSARFALDSISNKNSVKEILLSFVEDEDLLYKYIEHESRYKKDDTTFLTSIEENINEEITSILKKIVDTSFTSKFWYVSQNSNFIKKLSEIINRHSENYIFYLLKKSPKNLFSYKYIFSLLLKKEDVKEFIEIIKKKYTKDLWVAVQVLYFIKNSERKNKLEIFEEGKKYLKNEYEKQDKINKNAKKNETKIKRQIYNEFKILLKPTEKKYSPNVFKYYLNNIEELNRFINEEDKNRLKDLIINSIFDKFDPGKQKLTLTRNDNGTTTYTTHSWIFIFGDCIIIADKLNLDIKKYRQKILNYIPFAYDKHRESIFNLIPNPHKKEIDALFKIYIKRKDDLLHFLPSSTIEFYKKQKIKDAEWIIKEFITSRNIPLYEKQQSLLALSEVGSLEKNYYKSIFDKYKNDEESKLLRNTANSILIEKFEDKDAIDWRFKKIKEGRFPFTRPLGGHYVGDAESEIDDREFAKPLLSLKKLEYKTKFLKLLEESFNVYKLGKEYHEYSSYLWSIVLDYFRNLKELRNFNILEDIEKFINKNRKQEGINWFSYRYQQIKHDYIVYIGKPQNIADCIKQYNKFKEKIYLDIATPEDLINLVQKTINEDLKKWVEKEGAYKFLSKYKNEENIRFQKEDLIQKTIKTQFLYYLIKNGLRENEIDIKRESQLLNDERTDFLISYGFVGKVLIELKLTTNKEITSKKERESYRKKLIRYIEGTGSNFGIYIIFQVEEKNKIDKYLKLLEDVYADDKNITIIGLNCISS